VIEQARREGIAEEAAQSLVVSTTSTTPLPSLAKLSNDHW
jgi:hypothetical protein